ncbi:MAG: outer-membrane lipoprotein carrier protein LolA [Deltaproteobacteria bacterium]|nr:outer-membrane lipoprotein carrier protein LolA [Deltaproteobacteria bacterium]
MARKHIYLVAGVLALGVIVLWATSDNDKGKPTTAPPDAGASASATDGGPATGPDGGTEPVAPSVSADGSGGGALDTPLTTTASVTPPPTALVPKPTAKPTVQPTATPPATTTAKPTATVVPPKPAATQVAPADPGTADAVAEQVDAIYKPVTLFRARFKQKYVAKVAGKTKHSEGWAAVKRPRRISFKYKPPNKNRVVSDGKIIKIYEHDNQQMYVGNMAGTDYPGALSFIMGNGLRPNFTFTFHKTAKWEGGPVIIGIPRVANPGYKTVLFYIDEALLKKGDQACVRRVLVLDAQGNRNRFDFMDVEQPADIPNSEFTFKAPKGTEVLK